MVDLCSHFVLIDIINIMDLRSKFRLIPRIISNSSLGQPSKWLYYRFGWKNCFMYDDMCPMTLTYVICVICFDIWYYVILHYMIYEIILCYKQNVMLGNNKVCHVITCYDILWYVLLCYDMIWHGMFWDKKIYEV